MYIKYPRTYHLPWSEGIANDDKVMSNINQFIGQRVIVTEKVDGENTTMYNNHIHARSIDSKNHISRDWVKGFWNHIRYSIHEDIRICGENLYAKHSIHYTNLPSYFLGFSVWKSDLCLDWDFSQQLFEILNITSVPLLYDGIYDEKLIKSLYNDNMEGYVIRIADEFHYDTFSKNVGKFVRKNHVQTDGHWMNTSIVKNLLKDNYET